MTERYADSRSRMMKEHRRHLVHKHSLNRSHYMSGRDHLIVLLAKPLISYTGKRDKPRQWPGHVQEASGVLDESGTLVVGANFSSCLRPFPALGVVVTVARVVGWLLGVTDTVDVCETLLPSLEPPEDPPEHKLEASPTGYVVPLLHVLLVTSYSSVVSTGSPSGASLIIVSWPPGRLSSQLI